MAGKLVAQTVGRLASLRVEQKAVPSEQQKAGWLAAHWDYQKVGSKEAMWADSKEAMWADQKVAQLAQTMAEQMAGRLVLMWAVPTALRKVEWMAGTTVPSSAAQKAAL